MVPRPELDIWICTITAAAVLAVLQRVGHGAQLLKNCSFVKRELAMRPGLDGRRLAGMQAGW